MLGTLNVIIEALTAEDLQAPTSGLAAPRTINDLLARLRTERARGFAWASEEVEIGLTSVGIPIRDYAGTLTAVANVSGPTSRLITRTAEVVLRLRTAVTAIETVLARPYAPVNTPSAPRTPPAGTSRPA